MNPFIVWYHQALVTWKILIEWGKSATFWPISLFYLHIIYYIYDVCIYIYITFINIITYLIRKLFKYWEAVKLMVAGMVCQNSHFDLKSLILLLATDIASCFPWSDTLTSFIFKKMSAKYLGPNSHSLSVCHFFQEKKNVLWRKSSYFYFRLQLNHTSAFLPDDHPSIHSRSVFGILPTLSHSILKRFVL